MRTIKLTDEEVNTLFGAIFQQTSNLEERLKDASGTLVKHIQNQIAELDKVSKKIMHSGIGQIQEMEVRDEPF